MLNLVRSLLFAALAFVETRHQLAVEILALRHQLAILKRSVKRPRSTNADRGLWVLLSRRWESAPRYLLRDRDGSYGKHFRGRVRNLGIEAVVIARRSSWQSPYVERVIGTLRRELVDHVIVINGRHLRRLLRGYVSEIGAHV